MATLERAVKELAKTSGARVLKKSSYYETQGVGPGFPGVFVNSVVSIDAHCGPDTLLRRLKMIERAAGPRSALRWGPRTLDLDVLDYRGRVLNWPEAGRLNDATIRNRLVLPHPLLHERPFVLAPLNELAPDWRHPVLRLTARQLWSRKRNAREGRILKVV